jgi:hypothetical protein
MDSFYVPVNIFFTASFWRTVCPQGQHQLAHADNATLTGGVMTPPVGLINPYVTTVSLELAEAGAVLCLAMFVLGGIISSSTDLPSRLGRRATTWLGCIIMVLGAVGALSKASNAVLVAGAVNCLTYAFGE